MPQLPLAQRIRLESERRDLESHFECDKINWTKLRNETHVEVKVTCTNDKNYVLRVYITPDFPNSCPPMVVISPSGILRRKNGSMLLVASRQDHVLSSKDGYTQICHFRSNLWMGEITLSQVIKRGLVWLEAYELHLRTGDPLDRFLQAEKVLLHRGVPLKLE